jgi:hypothetical protein
MTRTVSVELTDNNLYAIRDALTRSYASGVYPGCYGMQETIQVIEHAIWKNEEQVRREGEREAKVKALDNATYHTAIPEGNRPVPIVILKHLNAAGWDLVRMEDT